MKTKVDTEYRGGKVFVYGLRFFIQPATYQKLSKAVPVWCAEKHGLFDTLIGLEEELY